MWSVHRCFRLFFSFETLSESSKAVERKIHAKKNCGSINHLPERKRKKRRKERKKEERKKNGGGGGGGTKHTHAHTKMQELSKSQKKKCTQQFVYSTINLRLRKMQKIHEKATMLTQTGTYFSTRASGPRHSTAEFCRWVFCSPPVCRASSSSYAPVYEHRDSDLEQARC